MRRQPLPQPGTRVLVSFSGTVVYRPDLGGAGAVTVDGYPKLVRRLDGTEFVAPLVSRGAAYPGGLSAREFDVLRLAAEGLFNPAIARELKLSVDSVKWHMRMLLSRFNAETRIELVMKALQRNIIMLGELCIEKVDECGHPVIRDLTDRESELLRLALAGLSGKEIAARMFFSPATVSVMLRTIRAKWGVESTEELMAVARQRGVTAEVHSA